MDQGETADHVNVEPDPMFVDNIPANVELIPCFFDKHSFIKT